MQELARAICNLGINSDLNQLGQFRTYCKELIEWNKKINLTAITDCREVQHKHFLDSLTLLPIISRVSAKRDTLIDIGSGAGFPGMPIKILWPDIRVTLVESVNKKASFLNHMKDILGLDGIEILIGRAESLAHEPNVRESFDIVVSRAVAELNTLAELTLPFCKIGGKVILHKGRSVVDEITRASESLKLLGGTIDEVVERQIDELKGKRYLVVLTKQESTPTIYPRKPGLPSKRPL